MLGRPEAEVAKFIERMEDKFCYPSHDVRLMAEVNLAVKSKIASLGFDPHDTTVEELYHGLQAKFAADAAQIDKALGVKSDSSFGSRLARAIELSKYITGDTQVWALKPTTAKNLLLSSPPKKLMKQLHYRSTTSMLKHEDAGELYLLAPYVESNTWQGAFTKAAAHLASNDYALSPINFVHPEAARWQAIAEPAEPNVSNKLMGSVSVWPTRSIMNAPLITLTLMLLQGIRQLGVDIDKYALATVHPALQWWSNMDYLISVHDEGPVSLNIHDVAHNHLISAVHENSVSHHGAKVLWAELTDRYQSLATEVQQAAETSVKELMPAAYVAEYQEA
jgi:hypothetical protein